MAKRAFLFPGQGAQHLGMARQLTEELPAAKDLFDHAADVLGFDLLDVCVNGPKEKLDQTDVSQPALFVAALASLEKLKAESPELIDECELTAGLSLGEYTALVFAESLTFEEGLKVVKVRGEAMQAAAEASPSGMVSALLLDRDQAKAIRDEASNTGLIELANFLCPGNTVLSGEKAACEKAIELIEAAGGRPIELAVAGAFHTELMRPAVDRLAEALSEVQFQPPRIPVISNVTAEPTSDAAEIQKVLAQQVVSPVRWEDSIRHMLDQGIEEFVEVGPGRVLTGLLKRIDRKKKCTATECP
ncbi:ACP S-malonyltransferase [Stratiformator vulcanicus]|uniref:Malonyl CoA-acyl carrier protein transacylase n=1 Tax=Stratiformator vulcanicus TaxID=2527980 RepID=A0A517R4R0_9PLAN|nr:ACP S-malonyltransferase [Stratiformator vulcanicus]QDT38868.1 Malonyl CoA-acyl carrier protein transacylase [Stratiformator vulcanicus]